MTGTCLASPKVFSLVSLERELSRDAVAPHPLRRPALAESTLGSSLVLVTDHESSSCRQLAGESGAARFWSRTFLDSFLQRVFVDCVGLWASVFGSDSRLFCWEETLGMYVFVLMLDPLACKLVLSMHPSAPVCRTQPQKTG